MTDTSLFEAANTVTCEPGCRLVVHREHHPEPGASGVLVLHTYTCLRARRGDRSMVAYYGPAADPAAGRATSGPL